MLSPLTGRLRPKPNDIGQMDLISKEPAPEECGVVKFLHVGLLLLGQPEASSGKEQAGGDAVAAEQRAAARGLRQPVNDPGIEGAGARGARGR